MDYLNYSNQLTKQINANIDTNQQGDIGGKSYNFGDLTCNSSQQQTNLPQQQQQTNLQDELIQLFPTPVLISKYTANYDRELDWILKQDIDSEQNCINETMGVRFNRQSDDRYVLDKPELANIRTFIEEKLQYYVTNMWGSKDRLIITQSWFNRNCRGERHHEHQHPNSMISGVWYPKIHDKMPPIHFKKPLLRDVSMGVEEYTIFNSASFMIPMNKGELVLFPSNLPHSVQQNMTDEERISLSFNTWPKGSLGSERELTYLPLDRCV